MHGQTVVQLSAIKGSQERNLGVAALFVMHRNKMQQPPEIHGASTALTRTTRLMQFLNVGPFEQAGRL